ncbi:hypothetical protein [Qipengyuania sp.]|uniref:hypothetical protein n=1 Tax=Qipengyuania sp. TaxID=2004515 RepID=UPI00373567A8
MNSRAWRSLLGALSIWAAHFFAIYGIGSIWPGTTLANVLTIASGLLALAGLILFAIRNHRVEMSDGIEWAGRVGSLALSIASLGVIWQTLPSIL